ncbi:hypothetical protein BH09BAC2_BH09BAC2_12220 [soil metagenome]
MKRFFLFILLSLGGVANAQQLRLNDLLNYLTDSSYTSKRFDAQIRSQQEAAKGAFSWMPSDLGAGLYMMPYNLKMIKGEMGQPGMGQFMISAQQMLPNRQKQNAEYNYMQSMTNVTAERKHQNLNELYAAAKKNYYQLSVDLKKITVLDDNERIIDFMIASAEIRYRNGVGAIDAYYKAKAALGNIHSMKLMLKNEIHQKIISLNSLMQRDPLTTIIIDTGLQIKNYPVTIFNMDTLFANRSDIKAMQRETETALLQQNFEKAKLKPEFGIRFDHMIPIGNLPAQFTLMGMVRIPLTKPSQRMANANIKSLRWQQLSIQLQQQAMLNEVQGMAYGMKAEFETKKKQLKIYEDEIIPAYRRSYQTMQIAYEQNKQQLFMLYDAWEKLYMIQLDYLDQVRNLLTLQAELDRILEIKV